jgi:hypothetical protein
VAKETGIESARRFYTDHELEFQRAAQKLDVADRVIPYSATAFDTWAVAAGYLPATAQSCGEIERGGIVRERDKLRKRINRASRRGKGLPRQFSIEADKNRTWKIELTERFILGRPEAIAKALKLSLMHAKKASKYTVELLEANDALDDMERLRTLHHINIIKSPILTGLIQLQEISDSLSNGRAVDFDRQYQRIMNALSTPDPGPTKRKRKQIK